MTLNAAEARRIERLENAVFGIEGDPEGGLLAAMKKLTEKIDKLYFAVVAAAISFSFTGVALLVSVAVN